MHKAKPMATRFSSTVLALLTACACTSACSESSGSNGTKKPPEEGPNEHPDAGPIDIPDGGLSCGEAPVSQKSFSRAALLEATAACTTYQLCQFVEAASVLANATREHAKAQSDETREAAQGAFREAMDVWSRLELFQFGPAAPTMMDQYHGKGLRSLIYAWPNVSRCRVEEQIAGKGYEKGFDKVLLNGRGLYAVEYGLFYEGTDQSCAASSATAKTWATLDEAAIRKEKARYAEAVAADVLEKGLSLYRAWSPSGENFSAKLKAAEGYPSVQEALNVVAWGLVYVEREIKDWKVGHAAGYTPTAPVDGLEAPFAKLATENLRSNLRGFRALFQGCGEGGEGLGFDDWLREAGHGDLADDIVKAYEGAQAAADAFPPFHQASADEIEALYQAIKKLTDLLKNEFFGAGSPINLKPPATIEGDTD